MAFDLRVAGPIRFAEDFELDLRSYELRRAGRLLKLERIPMELLVLLIEERGQLITRDRIVERVWGKDVFLDTDNSINAAIRKIRQVLKDDPEKPRFVQTITGRGYRFIAQVQEPGVEPSAEPVVREKPRLVAMQVPPPSASKRPRRAFLWIAILAFAVCGFFAVQKLRHAETSVASIHSIAVLPLDNLSGDPSQNYFADAMTDELITDLAKVGALRVTSRTTIALYKHSSKKLPEIARELKVDAVVEGSIVRAGQRVRVTAQLIRADTDQHIWAESYDRDFGDALQLQSDVARAITEQVRAQFTPEMKVQFGTSRSVNPEAYESYLRGRYHLYNEAFTDPRVLNEAKASFEEAIRRDPTFSPAYSGAAETYVWMGLFGQQPISSAEAFKLTREAVSKALELDPRNGEAYDALGVLKWHADNDWKAAEEAFNKSIALSPSYSCAHEDRAVFLALMGRREEALAELEKSKILDPGPDSAGVASGVFIQLRDWEKLLSTGRQQLSSNANDGLTHANLGLGYEGTGKFSEAIAEYQRAVELSNGDDLNAVASLGHAYAVAGRRSDAEKILHSLEQKARDGKASPYLPATIYAGLGEKDRALALIEKAYREKSLDVAWIFKSDLRTDNIRSDPRFQDLLHRTGLSQ